jgi:hypothetical protein
VIPVLVVWGGGLVVNDAAKSLIVATQTSAWTGFCATKTSSFCSFIARSEQATNSRSNVTDSFCGRNSCHTGGAAFLPNSRAGIVFCNPIRLAAKRRKRRKKRTDGSGAVPLLGDGWKGDWLFGLLRYSSAGHWRVFTVSARRMNCFCAGCGGDRKRRYGTGAAGGRGNGFREETAWVWAGDFRGGD